jgi:hypothetical protein
VWRAHRRRQQLRRGAVGAAEHADPAVDVGQPRHPLHGVVAIGAFIVRHGHAVRHVAAPCVLDDDDEAGLGQAVEVAARLLGILRVRRPLEQGGPLALAGRPVDIGAQDHAVAHPRRDVLLDYDRGRRRRLGGGRHQPGGDRQARAQQ